MTILQFICLVVFGAAFFVCFMRAILAAVSVDHTTNDNLAFWLVGMMVSGVPLGAVLDAVLP